MTTTTIHPITPSPELVIEWLESDKSWSELLTTAARWGADQELEACCEWLHWQNLATHADLIPSLCAARRPKPPSLKEQALILLDDISDRLDAAHENTIRRALEALPNG